MFENVNNDKYNMANHTQLLLSLATPLPHKKKTITPCYLQINNLYTVRKLSPTVHVNKHLNHSTIASASSLTT